jgi:hypothetical protein
MMSMRIDKGWRLLVLAAFLIVSGVSFGKVA